jgi:Zn-dependent protease
VGGLRVAKLLGIPIEVRLSFIFLLMAAFYGGILHGLGAKAVIVLLMGCASVLLHELGHAFVGRLLRVPTVGITLHALGGETRLAAFPSRPRDEVLIAAAGPAVSLLCAGGAGVWLLATNAIWAEVLMVVNLLLAGSNLIPALPLDGGRLLRAALVPHYGLRRATELAVNGSRLIAVICAVAGPLAGYWIFIPLGGMLWLASSHERALLERWCFSEAGAGAFEILDADGKPAGRRATTLGSTYVIEEHRSALGKKWVVRDLSGQVLLITDTPLGDDAPVGATTARPVDDDELLAVAHDTSAPPPDNGLLSLM